MSRIEIEPEGTYRPQFRLRWRGLVALMDRFPRLKGRLADLTRTLLRKFFDPGMVTTERVVEYPFMYEHLSGTVGPILDIGCAHSGLPIALASRGHRVVGLDYLPYPYRHPYLAAVRGDAMRCPFRAGSFGAVLAISVIEHIGLGHYGDPGTGMGDAAVAQEIARLLRPGGRAIITVPFGRTLADETKRVYGPADLRRLLAPLSIRRIEYAWSHAGLWTPCTEIEAASADWQGPVQAVAMIVATIPAGSGPGA